MTLSTWWATYGKHFPSLCKIAQCMLAQPSRTRNRLGHEAAVKLVYAHEALNLASKLQSAQYREAIAAWDDGDSDADANDATEVDDFANFTIEAFKL
eukprot:3313693-Pleurochrysis_carterae.AAC.1